MTQEQDSEVTEASLIKTTGLVPSGSKNENQM